MLGKADPFTAQMKNDPDCHVDCIFDMDGVEFQDNGPFPGEEEDEENLSQEMRPTRYRKTEKDLCCAASLPIDVPIGRKAFREDDDSDDLKVEHMDPEQIAKSIQALAWNCKDGTEIFGERPRRRLNTGELVRSRPI